MFIRSIPVLMIVLITFNRASCMAWIVCCSLHGIIKVISTRSYNISNVTKFMNTPLMKELQQQSQNMVVIMPCKEQQTIQAIQEALLNVMSTIIKTGIDLMNMKKDRSVSY